MNGGDDFTRSLRSWLHEDRREDPSRVLDRVAAAVIHTRRQRAWPVIGDARVAGSLRFALAGLVAAAVLAVGFGLLLPNFSIGPVPSPSPTTSPTASPSSTIDQGAAGLPSDQPCARAQDPAIDLGLATPYHHEDLERMVLSEVDVPGFDASEQDIVLQGYRDDAELPLVEVGPETTCADIQELGRLEGYANAYATAVQGSVVFAVHLFLTDEEAADWVDRFTSGLAAGASRGGYTFTEVPGGLDIANAALYEHVGPAGTRTWAIIERGPIVGWIVDLHNETPAIDVRAAATTMATRIETVSTEVAARPLVGLNADQLLTAPLPQAAYGPLAQNLAWDSFFGGCHDTAERGSIVGPKAVTDAKRFGRVTGCTAMYSNPGGGSLDVVRVFSFVHVYRDEQGASAALAENVADEELLGGERFAVTGIGDEAIGVATPSSGGIEGPTADTRVVMRLGGLLVVVSIQGPSAVGKEDYVTVLTSVIEARIQMLSGSPG